MSNREDARSDRKRLQLALGALAADLDAIERLPHISPRHTAGTSEGDPSCGIESFVDHFALAMQNGNAGLG
jgi:hypothetical protein